MPDRIASSIIPNPDPSLITSEAIDRRVADAMAILGARLDAADKAVEVFHADLTRVPTQLDTAIKGLRELIEARIEAVERNVDRIEVRLLTNVNVVQEGLVELQKLTATTEQKFLGLDLRLEERVKERNNTTKEAFAAQKELQAFISAGFTKAIDAQQTLLSAQTNANNDKISDLKDRLTAMENRTAGISTANIENRSSNTDTSTRMVAIFAVVAVVVIGIAEIITRIAVH